MICGVLIFVFCVLGPGGLLEKQLDLEQAGYLLSGPIGEVGLANLFLLDLEGTVTLQLGW